MSLVVATNNTFPSYTHKINKGSPKFFWNLNSLLRFTTQIPEQIMEKCIEIEWFLFEVIGCRIVFTIDD